MAARQPQVAACVDLGKEWLNRRLGFITKPVLPSGMFVLSIPTNLAGLNQKTPAIPSA
ncbi:MAG: hypothetical protein JWQ55_3134 [Rhodopila sp.]|jgi:hypothetical protein|nr:hypothetical protein [Rhodopila sp.]